MNVTNHKIWWNIYDRILFIWYLKWYLSIITAEVKRTEAIIKLNSIDLYNDETLRLYIVVIIIINGLPM